MGLRHALLRTPHLLIIPSAVDPPPRERARIRGSRWSAPRTNDLYPRILVCWAHPGSMADGMISSHPSHLRACGELAAVPIIPEPECPRRRH